MWSWPWRLVKENCCVDDMVVEFCEPLTMLTSCLPSALHRSTLTTNMPYSRLLAGVSITWPSGLSKNVLVGQFLASDGTGYDELDARRRGDGPSVLVNCVSPVVVEEACRVVYLVAETAHSRAYRLLFDTKSTK